MRYLGMLAWPVVIISNQSAVGRGLMQAEDVEEINTQMIATIEAAGGRVDRVYFCPHRPEEQCVCRKPKPGMLLKAAEELGLKLAGSFLVGDANCDVEAALAVRARPVLVLTGRGLEQLESMDNSAREIRIVRDLLEAVEWIRLEIVRAG
jgi:D-glycero-D-manno-heptose 1,7-bisphosphate phosphatase